MRANRWRRSPSPTGRAPGVGPHRRRSAPRRGRPALLSHEKPHGSKLRLVFNQAHAARIPEFDLAAEFSLNSLKRLRLSSASFRCRPGFLDCMKHQSVASPRAPGGRIVLFDDQRLDSAAGEVERDRGADHAGADDDDICRLGRHGKPPPSTLLDGAPDERAAADRPSR